MAADGITVKLEGVDAVKRALASAGSNIRTKAVRGALREAGKVIQQAARSNAPVLKTATPNRKPGTIKRNIVVRGSKFARRRGDEGVYVSVRALRGSRQKKLGRAGKDNPNDPYYWRFLEFGTRGDYPIKPTLKKALKFGNRFAANVRHPGVPAKRFMTRAADSQGQAAIQTFMRNVVPQIEKLNRGPRVR